MEKNYKLKITYDGTRYYGWERQPGRDTVQGKIEDVLSRMIQRKVDVIGAGRTDAGVHARGMIANTVIDFDGTPDELKGYLNRYLPDDIAVSDVKEAGDRFHARFLARSKIYMYTCFDGDVRPVFNRRYYTYIDGKLDIDRMREAAAFLVGEHDFRSFCGNPRMKKSTVRRLYGIEIKRSKGYVYFTFEGNGFLQYMVRIMTGTLIEVGLGKRKPEEVEKILAAKDRRAAGFTTPAKGLCLIKVKYG